MGGRSRRDAPKQDRRLVIVDSSAWVEYLRGTNSDVCNAVDALLRSGDARICDAIVMEVLAGARDDAHLRRLTALLAVARPVEMTSAHYSLAASVYRTCRQRGERVRRVLDCLIAAVAIDANLPVLHADRDFEVIARHTGLRVA